MANRVTVNICGEDYTLVAEESTAYMEQVAALVDKKMGEVIAGAKVGRSDAAVLAAVNLADELLHVGGALLGYQGVVLPADVHCDAICHSCLLSPLKNG